jgi:hypothetical protein
MTDKTLEEQTAEVLAMAKRIPGEIYWKEVAFLLRQWQENNIALQQRVDMMREALELARTMLTALDHNDTRFITDAIKGKAVSSTGNY